METAARRCCCGCFPDRPRLSASNPEEPPSYPCPLPPSPSTTHSATTFCPPAAERWRSRATASRAGRTPPLLQPLLSPPLWWRWSPTSSCLTPSTKRRMHGGRMHACGCAVYRHACVHTTALCMMIFPPHRHSNPVTGLRLTVCCKPLKTPRACF